MTPKRYSSRELRNWSIMSTRPWMKYRFKIRSHRFWGSRITLYRLACFIFCLSCAWINQKIIKKTKKNGLESMMNSTEWPKSLKRSINLKAQQTQINFSNTINASSRNTECFIWWVCNSMLSNSYRISWLLMRPQWRIFLRWFLIRIQKLVAEVLSKLSEDDELVPHLFDKRSLRLVA